MLPAVIAELGERIYSAVISPLSRSSRFDGLVLGFDTEYDSKTGKLVSFQLSDGVKSDWDTSGKMTVASLARLIERTFAPEPGTEIMLVSFFSIAELQFLPVKKSSFGWREYGAGSFDCTFFDERTCYALHVFDIARFFDKQPLSKVAESFGMKKLEWDRTRISRACLRRKGFRAYALNDAILAARIAQALRDQFEEWEVDPLEERTAASTAACVFRSGWIHEEVKCESNPARLAGLRSCWGGRAEALHRGSFRKLYEYDLASAYPIAAISLGELPCGDAWREVKTLRQLEACLAGVAQVRFTFPESERYPSLPVILPTCQLYPLEGEEWVTFDEVRLALKMRCKIKIIEAWGYKRGTGTTVLRDYMQEVLERRKNARGAAKVAYKLLANALIGKLAQRVSDIDIELLREKAIEHGILIDDIGKMNREELAALGLESQARVGSIFMPEWNALITGNVRARIGELVRKYEAVYVATDAIWTPHRITSLPDDLGLKRSGPGIVARTRLGAIFDDKNKPHVAHHSIWNRQAALDALKDLDGPRSKYQTRRPIKLRESLRKDIRFGRWVVESREADTYWDDKRQLATDGSSTPWRNVDEYRTESVRNRRERNRVRRQAKALQEKGTRGCAPKNRHRGKR